MTRVHCARCGVEHDLSEMEPGLQHPDACLGLTDAEWDLRVKGAKDWRVVADGDGGEHFFYRALMPMPVHGAPHPTCWGLWVEVSAAAAARIDELWSSPDQGSEPPFPATLANEIGGYPPTLGLAGTLQLTSPSEVPTFVLAGGLDHPLAAEQREGVPPERVLEWLMPFQHT